MSSIKSLKKENNNSIGGFIEEVYAWELSNPDADLKKSEALVDNAISLFDDLIEKIHKAKIAGKKEGFKPIKTDLIDHVAKLNQSLEKLG